MDGIIVINKPQGMTSHDVVSFLRRKTGERRIGHSGTLDPMATGVLPVYIGKATRVIEYASMPGDPAAKLYRCTMRLGVETDTQDIWGTPLSTMASDVCAAEIERVLKSFEGAGVQTPPMYSAVKVGGRKLYEYARRGETVETERLKARDIYIKHITVNQIDLAGKEVVFDVLCSKGVYIRTLCADAGRLLGCGAAMSGLCRLKSDGFSIDDAIPVDALRDENAALPPLLPADTPLAWLPRADLPVEDVRRFVNGLAVQVAGLDDATILRVYGPNGFVGLGEAGEDAQVRPTKVLSVRA